MRETSRSGDLGLICQPLRQHFSLNLTDIERLADGRAHVSENAPYRAAVFAMLALHEQFKANKNNHFAVLFNAYHGDVRDQSQLEQALDAFYRHDVAIADQLSR